MILLAALVLLTACSTNVENILPRKTGLWKVARYHSRIMIDTFVRETNLLDVGSMRFDKDGNGVLLDNFSILVGTDSVNFDWTYDETSDSISIRYLTGGGGETVEFDILESTKNTQHWFRKDSSVFGSWIREYFLEREN